MSSNTGSLLVRRLRPCSHSVKRASSSAIGGHRNAGTRDSGTGCDGRVSSCSGCLGGDDELPSPAAGALMVILDCTLCSSGIASGCLGPSLAGGAVMVTLVRAGCSSGGGGESPLLVGGWRMVTPGGGYRPEDLLGRTMVVTSNGG